MKRHHGNLLARPSVRAMASHFFREAKVAFANSFYPRKKNIRGRKKKDFHGGLYAMLTALLWLIYFTRSLFLVPSWQIRNFPRFALSGLLGSVIALSLVLGFAKWPDPVTNLDFNSLTSNSIDNPSDIALNQEYTAGETETQVPPELYPDYSDPAGQEPMLITSTSLPGETWFDIVPKEASVEGSPQPPEKEKKITDSEKSLVEKIQPKMRLASIRGAQHVIQEGENFWEISNTYNINHAKLVAYNPNINPRKLMPGQKVFIPGEKSLLPEIPKRNQMILPIQNPNLYVISRYGMRMHPIGGNLRFHRGVDLQPVNVGTPVLAVLDGVVEYSGPMSGKGLVIELKHDNNLKTVYAHNSQLLVRRDMKVKQGQVISKAGSTGYSTGPHLHFEVWKNGHHVDPVREGYLPKIKVKKTQSFYTSSEPIPDDYQ